MSGRPRDDIVNNTHVVNDCTIGADCVIGADCSINGDLTLIGGSSLTGDCVMNGNVSVAGELLLSFSGEATPETGQSLVYQAEGVWRPETITGGGGGGSSGYASGIANGNTTSALGTNCLVFVTTNSGGTISYSGGLFTINNSASLTPATVLVNVGYSNWDSEVDSGNYMIQAAINGGGRTAYGNTIYGVMWSGTGGGGASTGIVVVPASGTAQILVALSGSIHDGGLSISLVHL
jgi:hypothetical protein